LGIWTLDQAILRSQSTNFDILQKTNFKKMFYNCGFQQIKLLVVASLGCENLSLGIEHSLA
jgi:hypothetical protein